MSLRAVPKGPLREGYTTGTCAAAAAKAALWSVFNQKNAVDVSLQLPIDKVVTLKLNSCNFSKHEAYCSVIKDAGDDPDVTHGAEIFCYIKLIQEKEVVFKRGEGVGIVTLPGLELQVGEPAINPVPRKMIANALNKLLHDYDMECGVEVTVGVKDGEALAKRTLNERVGIMGGLSILGTTGIVKPYSSSSYIASIEQGVDVAIANNIFELVLNSGARSEKAMRSLFPNSPEQAFIHYGNWIGETLRKIASAPIKKVTIGIMLGKAVKLAEGRTDTHSCVASWNKEFVMKMAEQAGYGIEISTKITALNTAGRLIEIFDFNEQERFYQMLLKHCFANCSSILNTCQLDLYLVGKDNELIKYHNYDY